MASVEKRDGKNRWRVVWREGGRGSKKRYSEWFPDTRMAEDFKETLEEQRSAEKSTSNRLILPWSEVCAKWLKTKLDGSRYQKDASRKLVQYTANWMTTADATPAAMRALPIGAARVARACLRWAKIIHRQRVDDSALHVQPTRKRQRPPQQPMLQDVQIAAILERCAGYGPGTAALTHMLATYGHRAESLVGLTGSAIKDGHLELKVKSGDVIGHPLLPKTMELLTPLMRGPNDPLFRNHLGQPWKSGSDFSAWFCHTTGYGYYRAFKRPAISKMFAAGLDPKTIASITGHRTPSLLLDTYAQTNEQLQMKALKAIADSAPRKRSPRLTSKATKRSSNVIPFHVASVSPGVPMK